MNVAGGAAAGAAAVYWRKWSPAPCAPFADRHDRSYLTVGSEWRGAARAEKGSEHGALLWDARQVWGCQRAWCCLFTVSQAGQSAASRT